ncbi:MAG: EamA family transporter [Deltaproteobacteria bacterium]|nr:EamA family transporter [Deltaproteobacteria bacterium]
MSPELLALVAAFFYSSSNIAARLGLKHSTPLTVTCTALVVRTVTLWTAVYLTGGAPPVASLALFLFVGLGIVQTITSLFSYIGISKVGASRSQTLRSIYPLWSVIIAIAILQEEAGIAVLLGTLSVVAGTILISWRPEGMSSSYRWWHILYPLGAAFLAGIAFPVRRYALNISNEPLFFAALLAFVSSACLGMNLLLGIGRERLVWDRKAILPFILAGGFETLGALLSLIAVSVGQVVVVAPIVATSPLWTLVMSFIVLRDLEKINTRSVMGTISVVAGVIAIIVLR